MRSVHDAHGHEDAVHRPRVETAHVDRIETARSLRSNYHLPSCRPGVRIVEISLPTRRQAPMLYLYGTLAYIALVVVLHFLDLV